jgi:outer membrane usher protein
MSCSISHPSERLPPRRRQGAARRALARLAAQLALAVAGGCALAPWAFASDAPLLLGLRLNGVEQEGEVQALRVGDRLALSVEDWRKLGLRPLPARPFEEDGRSYQWLTGIHGVHWQIDESAQTLLVEMPATAFDDHHVGLDSSAPRSRPVTEAGGWLNYDLNWEQDALGDRRAGRATGGGLIDLGAFDAAGSLRTTGLLRSGGAQAAWTRLDSTWTQDQPERMTRLRVGDAVSQPGAWGNALRFGGLKWGTDFSLRPDFLTFPLPSLQGQAALPSTVDVYVNNSQRLQSTLPAGAFELSNVPVVTGQGELRMVVRDLLGREQVVVQPYYASPALLRPGLSESSYEIGALREDYGLRSNHYGPLFAAVTRREGVDAGFTREWRAERLGPDWDGGVTGIWMLPDHLGTANLTGAGSLLRGAQGAMLGGGVERQAGSGSGSLQWRFSSPHYQQAGQAAGRQPKLNLAAAGASALGETSVGFSVVRQSDWLAASQSLLAFNASRALGTLGALSFFVQRDLVNARLTWALSLSIALDSRSSLSFNGTRSLGGGGGPSGDGSVQWQRSVPEDTGMGWQVTADRNTSNRVAAQGTWQGDQASLSAGLAHTAAGTDVMAGASGGLAWLDRSVFMSRRADGSFAVVEVGDYPDVPVTLEHRVVGHTDSQGRVLVSGLRGHEANHIGIDSAGLPLNADVDGLDLVVIPPSTGGVRVRLPVQRRRSASFRLVLANGEPVPAGSRLQIEGQSREFPVGFNGKAFISGSDAHATLTASWPDGQCRAQVDLGEGAADDDMRELGTLTCV